MPDWALEVWRTLVEEFTQDLPGPAGAVRAVWRLLVAAALGGLLGWERQQAGKVAGLRTHMIVSLGAALFLLTASQTGMAAADLSRVFQGVATGIGFVGAGAILKQGDLNHVRGVTTAATIWLTAAVGSAAGAGRFWAALLGTAVTLFVLTALLRVETWMGNPEKPAPPSAPVGREAGGGD